MQFPAAAKSVFRTEYSRNIHAASEQRIQDVFSITDLHTVGIQSEMRVNSRFPFGRRFVSNDARVIGKQCYTFSVQQWQVRVELFIAKHNIFSLLRRSLFRKGLAAFFQVSSRFLTRIRTDTKASRKDEHHHRNNMPVK